MVLKPEKYGLRQTKEIFINTPDNLSLLAWFQKPKINKPIPRCAILMPNENLGIFFEYDC